MEGLLDTEVQRQREHSTTGGTSGDQWTEPPSRGAQPTMFCCPVANGRTVAPGHTGLVTEIPLRGGSVGEVVRLGDTVRRAPKARAEFVHRLLRYFEDRGWPGAPRFLGMDARGREILTYLDGHVPCAGQASVRAPENLVAIARLMRQFHDLTAGTALAGDQEVVCHNDLSPKNTVYAAEAPIARPIAFIDWDLAARGARIHDVAHMCWQYLNLGPGTDDIAEAASRLRLICDTYGLRERPAVIDTILWWQQRCRRGIDAGADDGDAAMVALREAGAVDAIRAAHRWVLGHRSRLISAH